MTSYGASEGDVTLFPPHMVKSDDPIGFQEQHQNQNVACQPRKELYSRVNAIMKFWNIFDEGDPTWRGKLGFLLTLLHLAGVIVIIVLYYNRSVAGTERPILVHTKFVPPERVNETALAGYICNCDIPAELKDSQNFEPKGFNRCYEPEELKVLDVLQFGNFSMVSKRIENFNKKSTSDRTFQDGYRLDWESYELMTPTLDNFSSENPLKDLNKNLTDLGYIGKTGYITVDRLADQPFFNVPQGFVKAGVDYNCESCESCARLWAKYNYSEATREVLFREEVDVGWIFCYESSAKPPDSSQCSGSCRFFRTYYKPWGIEMFNMAKELRKYINASFNPSIYFQSRVLFANVSSFSHVPSYNISFLEIERDGTTWAELLDYYSYIPACAEASKNEVVICNGTSICQTASVYFHGRVNSESLKTACINYATTEDFQIDRPQCQDMIRNHNITTHNETEFRRVCGAFKCKKVQAEQVYWNNYISRQGEVALRLLTSKAASQTTYNPGVCSNNYSDVYVHYDKSEIKILAIYETSCIEDKSDSKGCWLTGRYKHMNATRDETWAVRKFNDDEVKSNETLFACYRFHKKSYHWYVLDQIGIVAGIVGSWLLILSCIFWTSIKAFPKPESNPLHLSTRSDTRELVSPAWSRSQSLDDADRRSIDMFLRQP